MEDTIRLLLILIPALPSGGSRAGRAAGSATCSKRQSHWPVVVALIASFVLQRRHCWSTCAAQPVGLIERVGIVDLDVGQRGRIVTGKSHAARTRHGAVADRRRHFVRSTSRCGPTR